MTFLDLGHVANAEGQRLNAKRFEELFLGVHLYATKERRH
jgi:hypothetical protein